MVLAAAEVPGAHTLDIIWFMVIAIFTSITAPLILSYITGRQQHAEKQEDYRRQDAVARKAELVAEELQQKQAEIAASAAEAARLLVERQDEQAAKAAEAARLLLRAQQATIARTDEVARLAAMSAEKADLKLDHIDAQARRIHTLVNSDMTAARQSELDQTKAMLVVLDRVVALSVDRGLTPRQEDLEAVGQTRERITELEQILADRMTQLRIVEAEARTTAVPLEG